MNREVEDVKKGSKRKDEHSNLGTYCKKFFGVQNALILIFKDKNVKIIIKKEKFQRGHLPPLVQR